MTQHPIALEADGERLLYLGAGPLAAILLGMALVPLRGFTTASNFTFLFLALTILVGELGGRAAAVATAIAAALSLDFFLTEPYMRLSIDSKHDVIACLGLAGCGILAASLAAGRRVLPSRPRPSPRQIERLENAAAALEREGSREAREAAGSVLAVVAELRADPLRE
jgi:K+-sensing histidine kinase KdpD